MADSFHCMLVTPEAQLLDEPVEQVRLTAWDGQMGVLAGRAPMLVKLGYGPMRLEMSSGQSVTYFVGGGFAQMHEDRLTILTREATPAEQLTVKQARAALNEALALKSIGEASATRREQAVARARGMLALAQDAGE